MATTNRWKGEDGRAAFRRTEHHGAGLAHQVACWRRRPPGTGSIVQADITMLLLLFALVHASDDAPVGALTGAPVYRGGPSDSPLLTLVVEYAQIKYGEHDTMELKLFWEGENLDAADDDAAAPGRMHAVTECVAGGGVAGRHVLVLFDNAVVKALPVDRAADQNMSCESDREDCQPYGRCCGGSVTVSVPFSVPVSGHVDRQFELQLLVSDSSCRRDVVMHGDRLVRAVELYTHTPDHSLVLLEPSPPAIVPEAPIASLPSSSGRGGHAAEIGEGRGKGECQWELGESGTKGGADFSTHRCAGASIGSQSPQGLVDATCLFENVCMLDGQLTYLVHPNMSGPATQVPRLHALSRLWSATPREPCPVWEEVEVRLRRGYLGEQYPRTRVPYVYIRRIEPGNAGHTLGDDAWAIFQGMVHFEALEYGMQVVIDDDSGPGRGASHWSNKVFQLVSGRPVIGRSSLRFLSLCFDKFVTGWGGLGFGSGPNVPLQYREPSVRGKGPLLRQWRRFAYSRLLERSPSPASMHGLYFVCAGETLGGAAEGDATNRGWYR